MKKETTTTATITTTPPPPGGKEGGRGGGGGGGGGGKGPTPHHHPLHLPLEVTVVQRDAVRTFSHHKKVGSYLLGRSVGEGSFAKVKEGLHLATGEKVAVKVIDKKRAQTDRYVRKNLRREGRLLQQIRHKHVIQLLEVMETEHCYYLVTEVCAGGDLLHYITKRKRLDEKEAKKFIRQIVSAVDYLHRLGIIHRDLKIENLLLDENRNIKLIGEILKCTLTTDFGLSNTIKVSTAPAGTAQEYLVTQCGSPAYAAPELLNHQKYGLPVDVWSIGVNMYAMLTGSLPFTVHPFNIRTLYNKMVTGDMNPLPPGLTLDARDLLGKFLKADPEQRVTITQALRHPWLAEGRHRPMERSPFPNRLKNSDLHADILKHMSDTLDFKLSEAVRLVLANVPSSACATYYLYQRKLQRHLALKEVQGRSGSDAAQSGTELGRVSAGFAGETTLTSRLSAPDTRTQQEPREDIIQKEALTSDNPPPLLLYGCRKSTGTAKTGAATATRSALDETGAGREKEKSRLLLKGHGLEEPQTSTEETGDSNRREEKTPSAQPTPFSRHEPHGPTPSAPSHLGPEVRPLLKPALGHPGMEPHPQLTLCTAALPRTAGPKAPTFPAATLRSSGLLLPFTRKERTLIPLTRSPRISRNGSQGEGSGRSDHYSPVRTVCVVRDGQGGRKGRLVLRKTQPSAACKSLALGPASNPLENGVTPRQHVLQKRFQNNNNSNNNSKNNNENSNHHHHYHHHHHQRQHSLHTTANVVGVETSDQVIQVRPLRGSRPGGAPFNKHTVSPHVLPTICHDPNKRSQNETVHSLLEERAIPTVEDAAGNPASDKLRHASGPHQTLADVEVAAQLPVSQSVVSSTSRDLRLLPVIDSGVTPRQ